LGKLASGKAKDIEDQLDPDKVNFLLRDLQSGWLRRFDEAKWRLCPSLLLFLKNIQLEPSAQEGSFQNRYQRVSEATGKEVPGEEIVRGFEVERDNFVVISDDELKEAAPEKSAAIEIQEFVNESQSRPFILKKPYYLEPDKGRWESLRPAAKRSPNPGKAVSRNSCCAIAKACAYWKPRVMPWS
jgi:hypothetical protein